MPREKLIALSTHICVCVCVWIQAARPVLLSSNMSAHSRLLCVKSKAFITLFYRFVIFVLQSRSSFTSDSYVMPAHQRTQINQPVQRGLYITWLWNQISDIYVGVFFVMCNPGQHVWLFLRDSNVDSHSIRVANYSLSAKVTSERSYWLWNTV